MRAFVLGNLPKPSHAPFALPKGPLVLEIGAGQGLHAIQFAKNHPQKILLAVEQTHTRFAKLAQRARHHPELHNLIPIHADAVAFVAHTLPDNSLEQIFLLYPNPYPKAKQGNLRWHNRPFMELLLSKMKTNATLTLATNLEWYAHEAAEKFTTHWNLHLLTHTQVPPTSSPRTHFEKKYLARGETCWNLEFRKVE